MSDPGLPTSSAPDPAPSAPDPAPRSGAVRVLLVVLALVLVAGGTAAVLVLRPEHVKDKVAYPKHWDSRVLPYVQAVEKLRGHRFLHPVAVRFLPGTAFEKTVTSDEKDLDKNDRKELAQETGLMRAMGLIGGDVDLFKAFNDAEGAGTLAYYSFDKKEIVIRGTSLTLGAHATLVHELTHALQDQYFDISAKQKADAKKSDANDGEGGTASGVYDSIVEGDAERVAQDYRESLPSSERTALAKAEADADRGAEDAYKNIPKIVVTMMSSPYTLGEAMVQTVATAGGNDAVDELLRDPPTHEAALLDPLQVVARNTSATHVSVPALAPGEKKFADDEFGALSWYFVLSQRLPLREALATADGWGGDDYVAFDRSGTTCTRVDVTGRTDADTTRWLTSLQQWARSVPGAPATARRDGNLVVLESCDPGKAASTGKDASDEALALATVRGQLGTAFLKSGLPAEAASCVSAKVVDEYSLATLTGDTVPAGFRERLQQLALACRQ